MKEEEEFFLVYGCVRVGHSRATTGTGRANFLVFWVVCMAWSGTAMPVQARAVPRLWRS